LKKRSVEQLLLLKLLGQMRKVAKEVGKVKNQGRTRKVARKVP
jgi:hypothetical protein